MRPQDLLINYRYCSSHFNRDEYPELFSRIERDIEAYLNEGFKDVQDQDVDALIRSDVDEILNEVESNMDRHKLRFRKKSVFTDDHLVLSLFVAPAASHIGTPIAKKFSAMLAENFMNRFPGTTFKVGDYDEIMEGFSWKLTLIPK